MYASQEQSIRDNDYDKFLSYYWSLFSEYNYHWAVIDLLGNCLSPFKYQVIILDKDWYLLRFKLFFNSVDHLNKASDVTIESYRKSHTKIKHSKIYIFLVNGFRIPQNFLSVHWNIRILGGLKSFMDYGILKLWNFMKIQSILAMYITKRQYPFAGQSYYLPKPAQFPLAYQITPCYWARLTFSFWYS